MMLIKNWVISLGCALFMQGSLSHAVVDLPYYWKPFPYGKQIHGENLTADDLHGKVVLLEYWGIMCAPCRATFPHLEEIHKKNKNNNLQVMAIHYQPNINKAAENFLKSKKITFPVFHELYLPELPMDGLPCTYLIGENGYVVRRIAGSTPELQKLYKSIPKEFGKLEKGYPILRRENIKKYEKEKKNLLSSTPNLEGKINVYREQQDDIYAQRIVRSYEIWLNHTRGLLLNILKTDPQRAINLIKQFKSAVPSNTDFDEVLKAANNKADLKTLPDLVKFTSEEVSKTPAKKLQLNIPTSFKSIDEANARSANDGAHHYFGPRTSSKALENKVVMIEYWGMGCAPCLAAFPFLVETYNKYKNHGFELIASNVQGWDARMSEFLKSKEVTFPNYFQLRIPNGEVEQKIPYAVLVNSEGKIVAKGNPKEVALKIPEELAKINAPTPLLQNVQLKKQSKYIKQLTSHTPDIEAKIAPLRNLTNDEEAVLICKTVDNWKNSSEELIDLFLTTNPVIARDKIFQYKKSFPQSSKYDEQWNNLKDNKDLIKITQTQSALNILQEKLVQDSEITENEVKNVRLMIESLLKSESELITPAAEKLNDQFQRIITSD